MIYVDLFLAFLTVGCFSFGGAYGAIPLIRDVVMSFGWMGDEELSYMIAVSESTPGPIMVNIATYVGKSQGGVFGAFVATFAVVLPAFVVILLICSLMKRAMKNPYVQAVLSSLKPCVVGIVLATGAYMMLKGCVSESGAVVDATATVITAALALLFFGVKYVVKKKFSPILLIIISAVVGMAVYAV